MDSYIADLEKLSLASEDMCGKAIYQGAKVITDQIRKNIEALPVIADRNQYRGGHDGGAQLKGITRSQKQGLLDGLGIARMQDDHGFLNVKVGMDGYNSTKTKKYPNGQPNAMIARSLESGSSVRTKDPFISKAIRSKKAEAEKAMAEEFDKETKKVFR